MDDEGCARIAARQYGLLTYHQALEVGMTPSAIHYRVRSGRWERVLPRVYRILGTAATWESMALAASLWGGEGTFVSHLSAGRLWHLVEGREGPIFVSNEGPLKSPDPRVEVHQAMGLVPPNVGVFRGIPVTSPARTLVDLASVLDPPGIEDALDKALRRNLITVPRLAWEVRQARGRRGVARLRRIIEERMPGARGTESALERQVLRVFEDAALPLPEVQYEIVDGDRFVARVDFAYPEARLAIEVDSLAHHFGREPWEKDRERRNAVTAAGWKVMHVTKQACRSRPQEVAEQVRRALGLQVPRRAGKDSRISRLRSRSAKGR